MHPVLKIILLNCAAGQYSIFIISIIRVFVTANRHLTTSTDITDILTMRRSCYYLLSGSFTLRNNKIEPLLFI